MTVSDIDARRSSRTDHTDERTRARSFQDIEHAIRANAASGVMPSADTARTGMAMIGLWFALGLFAAAWVGPLLSPYAYDWQDLASVNEPPSWEHWAGTDALGRDYLTRILMGGRTAFLVAAITTSIAALLGLIIGSAGAYLGGWVDATLMRLADTLMSFLHLLFAMFVVGTVRPPITAWLGRFGVPRDAVVLDFVLVFGALAAIGWAGEARLVRSQVLSLRQAEFVTAARSLGASNVHVMRKQLLPNALGPLIVSASTGFGGAMLSESSLSFLGVGIRPPGASWGNMISENLVTWRYQPHLLAIPGVVLALAVLAFNFIGDGVNDALNPRRQGGRHK